METLPIIDITPFLTNALPSPQLEQLKLETATQIHSAIVSAGFFYIKGIDSVFSPAQMKESIQVAREFFALPIKEKEALAIRDGDGARGYQKLLQNITQGKADTHEGYDLYREFDEINENLLLHGANRWPSNDKCGRFKEVMEKWIQGCHLIGMALMEATAMGAKLTEEEWKELRGSVDDSFWVMRCIAYPPLPEDAAGISCGAHRDYGCWTLLHADSDIKGALQVFLKDPAGDSEENGVRGNWIQADPIENHFVCNIGEMWNIWSNSMYTATLHRVIHKSNSQRISIPFFFEPNFTAVVRPLDSFGIREDGKKKDSVIYGEFLAQKVGGNFEKY